MKHYVSLDIQSSYSIGKSICTIPHLVRKARELGLPALALTDDGFLFGAKEFYNECRRLGGSYGDLPPIKPVIGLSIGFAEDGAVHMIRLLAKNADGYRNLVRIASEGAVFEKNIMKYFPDPFSRAAVLKQLLLTSSDEGEEAKSQCHRGGATYRGRTP